MWRPRSAWRQSATCIASQLAVSHQLQVEVKGLGKALPMHCCLMRASAGSVRQLAGEGLLHQAEWRPESYVQEDGLVLLQTC